MVQNSLAPSQFLLPGPGDVPRHKPRPLNGLIPQRGVFSQSRAPEQHGAGPVGGSSWIQWQVMAMQSLEARRAPNGEDWQNSGI